MLPAFKGMSKICAPDENKRNIHFREGSDERIRNDKLRIRPVPRWTDRPTVAASCRCSSSSTSDGPDARCLEGIKLYKLFKHHFPRSASKRKKSVSIMLQSISFIADAACAHYPFIDLPITSAAQVTCGGESGGRVVAVVAPSAGFFNRKISSSRSG